MTDEAGSGGVLVHGTVVEIGGLAALLRGPSGCGKSDLALRLIEGGARLVADDQARIAVEDGVAIARPPRALAGRIEIRGVGLVALPAAQWVPAARLGLVVDLVAPDAVERMPEPAQADLAGVNLPLLALAPLQASAPAKLRQALRLAAEGQQ